MRHLPTEFSVCVTRLETDRAGRDYDGCASITGAASLPEALATGYRWATFYAGPRGARVEITEQCLACQGAGVVTCKAPRASKRCPACRGVGTVHELVFTARPADECTILRYGEPVFGQLPRAAE